MNFWILNCRSKSEIKKTYNHFLFRLLIQNCFFITNDFLFINLIQFSSENRFISKLNRFQRSRFYFHKKGALTKVIVVVLWPLKFENLWISNFRWLLSTCFRITIIRRWRARKPTLFGWWLWKDNARQEMTVSSLRSFLHRQIFSKINRRVIYRHQGINNCASFLLSSAKEVNFVRVRFYRKFHQSWTEMTITIDQFGISLSILIDKFYLLLLQTTNSSLWGPLNYHERK